MKAEEKKLLHGILQPLARRFLAGRVTENFSLASRIRKEEIFMGSPLTPLFPFTNKDAPCMLVKEGKRHAEGYGVAVDLKRGGTRRRD